MGADDPLPLYSSLSVIAVILFPTLRGAGHVFSLPFILKLVFQHLQEWDFHSFLQKPLQKVTDLILTTSRRHFLPCALHFPKPDT